MAIQPSVHFSFQPKCHSYMCFCCSVIEEEDDDTKYIPDRSGVFKPVGLMSDNDIEKANERFKKIIVSKIDPLPLDNERFLDILENEGCSLEVTRENPLTRKRLHDTVDLINSLLSKLHVD